MIIFNNDSEAGLSKREGFVYQNKWECTKQDPIGDSLRVPVIHVILTNQRSSQKLSKIFFKEPLPDFLPLEDKKDIGKQGL